MLSRYFSFKPSASFVSLSLVTAIGFAPVVGFANSNVLLDSTGKPLPNDFGALIELLDQSSDQKRKILGYSTPSSSSASKPLVVSSKNSDKEKIQIEAAEKTLEKPKNPAFYNTALARRLYDALDVGDTAKIKQLLGYGAGNAYVSAEKNTSLRLAVRKRWASVVRVLLERDPDLEQKLSGNVNLLHEASVQGAYDIAKMLIEVGVDPEEKTSKNWTNLHLAARYGHVDMVRYYLSLGLDPNSRNSEGNTAHWLANHLKHYQVAGYLSSRTNATSHEIFDNGKPGKKSRKKRSRSKRTITQAFSPAQLEALKNL